MKFQEWMAERHPEAIEEGFFKNLALGAAIGAGAMGVGNRLMSTPPSHPTSNRAAATARADDFDDDDDDNHVAHMQGMQKKLQAAAQRVGIPKSQWGNLKGHAVGGIVTVVNGKKVPLTPKEAEHVSAVQQMARDMGN